jgi:two-component system OmpR family sensor kinase
LTVDIFLLVAAVVVVALVIVGRLLNRELTRELAQNAEAHLRYIEGVMRHHDQGDDRFVRQEMADLEARSGALIGIWDGNRPLFESAALTGRPLPQESTTVVIGGRSYRTAAAQLAGIRALVAVPASAADRLSRSIDITMFALLGAGLIVVGLVARLVADRIVRPIDAVTLAAERIGADTLASRLEPTAGGYTEVHRLATSFNHMLARLETAVGRLRRFTADAAHELRTPLTAMKAQVQSVLAARSFDDAPAVLQRLLGEINRLSDLGERLLVLSTVDAASVERRNLDLSDLVVERVESASARAAGRDMEISLEVSEPVQIVGDVVLLRQAVDNLLDNAIKYGRSGGRVRVSLHRHVTSAVLIIADDGAGISREALPHVFDRFYREDSSRARETGGAGLGLAIVAGVAQAHGGQVTAESQPGDGTTFKVEIPIRPA